jgi:hypothetical protein
VFNPALDERGLGACSVTPFQAPPLVLRSIQPGAARGSAVLGPLAMSSPDSAPFRVSAAGARLW